MSDIPINKLGQKEHLLQIIPLGDEMPYDFKKPHRHDYFEFFMFEKGGGTHYIDFEGHEIQGESVHVIFPSQIHLLKRKGARGKIVICGREFMNELPKVFYTQLFQMLFSQPNVVFTEQGYDDIARNVQMLEQELGRQEMMSTELAKNYMCLFLAACIRNADQAPNEKEAARHASHHLQLYKEFTGLLERYFDAQQPVSFYAQQMGITAKVLNHATKKATGKTCGELLQERTLTEAKRLLLYTDDSSKEIAYTLSFSDHSYFTRFFKKHEGQTPGAFKAHWEEKYHS